MGKVAGNEILTTCADQNATILAPKNDDEFTELFTIYKTVLGKVALVYKLIFSKLQTLACDNQ